MNKYLLGLLRKGKNKIYYKVADVSRSGMTRKIDFYVIVKNEPIMLNRDISELLDYKMDNWGHLKITGCGMDMGFKVISELSTKLFDDYNKIKYSSF